MDYNQFILDNLTESDVSHRGGSIKVNAGELFPNIDNPTVGAYQNYLGGGLLGAVVGAAMFDPGELKAKDQKIFKELLEACKKYLHAITRHTGDEWEDQDYNRNQEMPVSAY